MRGPVRPRWRRHRVGGRAVLSSDGWTRPLTWRVHSGCVRELCASSPMPVRKNAPLRPILRHNQMVRLPQLRSADERTTLGLFIGGRCSAELKMKCHCTHEPPRRASKTSGTRGASSRAVRLRTAGMLRSSVCTAAQTQCRATTPASLPRTGPSILVTSEAVMPLAS